MELGPGQYVGGEPGIGFDLLVITLSPALWCPEENEEGDAENPGGRSGAACA